MSAFVASSLLAGSLAAQVLTESFTGASGSTPTGWVFDGVNYTPNLTGPADGGGWLRLTSTGNNQATSAYFDTAFSATGATVYASFDYASWGGSGADGIAFFLFDGSTTFSVGADGGSLGYAQKTGVDGLAGGYIGVGIDEFGNYSNATEGRVGGPGFLQDAIAVRGSEASGYTYLGGSGTLATSIDTPSVGTRPTTINTVQVLLTATNQLTVTLQQGGVTPQTVLQMDLSAYTRPETLKLGFTSGTGGSTNYHEVRNIEASTIASSLWNNQGDSLWGTNTNWDPTVVPETGSDILFDNSYMSTNQTIDVGTDRSVRSVTFDAPFDYTLNNNTLIFDNEGVAGFSGIAVTETRGTGDHTINSDLDAQNDIYIRNTSEGSLTINGDLATNGNTITFDGTGSSTTDGGVISGSGDVIKSDSGTVTFTGANTYSGGTEINNGVLNANNAGALGSGAVDLNGGTLGSTNGSTVNNTIALNGNAGLDGIGLSGTVTQTGSNTLSLANATLSGSVNLSTGTLTTNVTEDSTISGIISNGSLTKDGAGELTLSGNNTYTGATTINDGTLSLGGNDRLNNATDLVIGSSGTFNLNGYSERIDNLTASDGATLDFGATPGANTFLFDTYTPPGSGVMVVNNWEQGTDTFATTVNGQTVSSIYLSGYGVATYSGSTTTYDGSGTGYILDAIAETEKEWDGSSSNNWSTNGNWTSSGEPSSSQVALFDDLGDGRPDVYLNRSYTIRGITFGDLSTASYNLTSPDSTTRTLTLAYGGGVPFIQQQNALDQTINIDILRLGGDTVADITGAGDLIIQNQITETGGSRSLIRDGSGAGKLVLGGNNTYSGGLYVNSGLVEATSSGALGTGTANISAGAGLELNGTGTINEAINVAGSGVGGAGAIHNTSGSNTLSGTITETGATTFAADTGTTLTLSGNLTGTNTNTTFKGPGNITANQITTGSGKVTIDNANVTYSGGSANTYTSTTTLNSGTLTLNKTAGVDAIGTGGLIINASTVTLNQNNQINDAASVTLNGSGTLNLNNNTETIAQLNSASATTTVALGTGNITVGAPSVVNSNYAGQITGGASSSFNVDGDGTVYLSGNNTGFSGTTNVLDGSLNISTYNEVLGSGAINVSDGGNLQLQGGLNIDNTITINGQGTAANGALENYNGSNTVSGSVVLGSAARINSAAGTLTVSGNLTGSGNALTVGGAGNTLFSGVIGTGSGTLTKTGSGTVTLSGANTYTGATTVSQGTLVARNDTALGTIAGGTSVADAATLRLENNISIGMETLTVTGSGRLLNASGENTYGGLIQGTGNVEVSGGRLTLTKTNTYTGDTTVASGTTLELQADDALGGGGTTTVQSGGTLALSGSIKDDNQTLITISGTGDTANGGTGAIQNISGNNTLIGPIALAGDATITSDAGSLYLGDDTALDPFSEPINLGASTLTFNTDTGSITVGSTITGTGGITKTGSGTLLLENGINSFTGTTNIKDGTLILDTYEYDAGYPTEYGLEGDVVIGDNIGAANSAIFQQGASEAPGTSNEYIKDSQSVTVNSDGYWNLRGYKETINNLTMNGGTIDAKNSVGAGDRLDVTGTITASNATTSTINGRLGMNNDTAKSIVVDANATLDVNAILSNGGFVKTGDGTLVLSGANTFTGDAKIDAGIVRVDNDNGLGATAGITKVTGTGAQLQLDGVSIASETLQLAGTGIANDGALLSLAGTTNTWGGSVSLTANAEIQTATGSTLTINGGITGSGTTLTVDSIGDTTFNGINTFGTLEKNGAGNLTVTNTNTYATANVNEGTFTLGASNILSNTMDINLGSTGTFDVNTRTDTIGDLNGTGTLTIASGGNLTIDQLGNTGGGFGGTLDIDGIMTLNGGVINGADGSGSTGDMILTAGNTLEIASNFTFGTVGTMGGGDQLGSLTLGDGATLLLTGGGTLNVDGDSIIDFTGGEANTLNLGSLTFTEGSTLTINGWNSFSDLWTSQNFPGATLDIRDADTAKITFSGFSNTDTIWLTYDYGAKEITVPEPSSYGAILMGFGLAAFLLRRRPRSV